MEYTGEIIGSGVGKVGTLMSLGFTCKELKGIEGNKAGWVTWDYFVLLNNILVRIIGNIWIGKKEITQWASDGLVN